MKTFGKSHWYLLLVVAVLTSIGSAPIAKADDDDDDSTGSRLTVDMTEVPADPRDEHVNLRSVQTHIHEGFKLKRTLHYSIIYDTSEEDMAMFAAAIEKTYRACGKVTKQFDLDFKAPEHKLLTHYFNDFDDYLKYSAIILGADMSDALGFYAFGSNYSYFYNQSNMPQFKARKLEIEKQISEMSDMLRRGDVPSEQKAAIRKTVLALRAQQNRMNTYGGEGSEKTLQHEIAHQVLSNTGFHNKGAILQLANPRWVSEGMAMLFEPVADGSGSGFGRVNPLRLPFFQQMIEHDAVYPVDQFVSDQRFFFSGNVGGQTYPQAWALCHYLTRTKREEFKAYLKDILKRDGDYVQDVEKELELFEKHFGEVDKKWEKRFIDYMKKVRS